MVTLAKALRINTGKFPMFLTERHKRLTTPVQEHFFFFVNLILILAHHQPGLYM